MGKIIYVRSRHKIPAAAAPYNVSVIFIKGGSWVPEISIKGAVGVSVIFIKGAVGCQKYLLRGQLECQKYLLRGQLGCQKYLLRGHLGRYRRDVGESVHRSEVYKRRLYLVENFQ